METLNFLVYARNEKKNKKFELYKPINLAI